MVYGIVATGGSASVMDELRILFSRYRPKLMLDSSGSSNFRSTRWTLIGRAAGSSASGRHDALQELLQIYLPTLQSWLKRKFRMDEHEADDFIQDFVVSRILQKKLLKAASEQRGRFRSLLLSSLEHFVIDKFRRQGAARRAHYRAESFDESSAEYSSADQNSDDSFDADWAHSVLREAILRMWKERQSEPRDPIWTVFVYRVLAPLATGREPIAYERLLTICGFTDPRQASNALITAKRMFTRLLRSVIDDYAMDESEVDIELSELKLVLLRRGTVSAEFLPEEVRANLPFQTAIADSEGAPDREISRLFSIESIQGSTWGTTDAGAIVDHFFKLSLESFLGDSQMPEKWKKRTVRHLFNDSDPPETLLKAVKNAGRTLVENSDEPTPPEVGAFFYFLAIAACLVRHDSMISSSSTSVLQAGIRRLRSREWLDDNSASVFDVSLSKLQER